MLAAGDDKLGEWQDVKAETRPDAATRSNPTTGLIENLFRREYGRLTAILLRTFGMQHLNAIEDAVQEALLRALSVWPYYGLPRDPTAWLYQTARRVMLDVLKHGRLVNAKNAQVAAYHKLFENLPADHEVLEAYQRDSQLRVIFLCAHPQLSRELQLTLTLKMVGGFGVTEISQALLASPAAVKRRISRALAILRATDAPCDLPGAADLNSRMDAVLTTIYLMFNEGYKAAAGKRLTRPELCEEAVRLAELLLDGFPDRRPIIDALLALMYLNLGRFAARTGDLGDLLPMEEQDRKRWDQSLIASGILHLRRSAVGDLVSRYHIEAAIAACHCAAGEYRLTDWPRILHLYDQLATLAPTPIVRLNRSVAIFKARGAREAFEALKEIGDEKAMDGYYLFHAVRGEFLANLGDFPAACEALTTAIHLCHNQIECDLLVKKRQRLTMPR